MASTTFTDNTTVVFSSWLNDVNSIAYNILGNGTVIPTTAAQARTNLGSTTIGDAIFITVSAAAARSTLGAAQSGSNADITTMSALTTVSTNPVSFTGGDVTVTAGAVEFARPAAVASAATVNLDTVLGNSVDISGTTTITAITLSQGHIRWVRFTGILTLTNSATLVLPNGQNIITQSGDWVQFIGDAASVVFVTQYLRADGTAIGLNPGLGGILDSFNLPIFF